MREIEVQLASGVSRVEQLFITILLQPFAIRK